MSSIKKTESVCLAIVLTMLGRQQLTNVGIRVLAHVGDQDHEWKVTTSDVWLIFLGFILLTACGGFAASILVQELYIPWVGLGE